MGCSEAVIFKGGLWMRECSSSPIFLVECLNIKIITRKALCSTACNRGRLRIQGKKYSKASYMLLRNWFNVHRGRGDGQVPAASGWLRVALRSVSSVWGVQAPAASDHIAVLSHDMASCKGRWKFPLFFSWDEETSPLKEVLDAP